MMLTPNCPFSVRGAIIDAGVRVHGGQLSKWTSSGAEGSSRVTCRDARSVHSMRATGRVTDAQLPFAMALTWCTVQ
jgi:hypothetical protein